MFTFSRPRDRKPSAGRSRLGLEALEDRCVPSNSAAFLGADTTTQGSWQGNYGGAGYVIQGGSKGILQSLPSQDKVTVSGASTYTYADATDNLRGLQQPGNATAPRVEAGWFNYIWGTPTTGFDITLKLPGGQTDPVTPLSLYVEDWDGGNRSETIQPLDAVSRAPLADPVTVSNFRDGVYLNWTAKGNVTFHVEKLTGPNAEVSAVFLGGASAAQTPSGSATFVPSATTTGGNWQAAYGAEGYDVYGATQKIPSNYAKVSPLGDSFGTYTFANSTSDARGLVNPTAPANRIAVAQYSTDSFTLDVNLKDGNTHQVTLYAVDWDNVGRNQKFEVIDANTGKVWDTQYLSSFRDGAYLSWTVSGHVQIRVTSLNAQTCLVQGMFFGGPVPQPAGATLSVASLAASPVATPSTTVATADSPVATTASPVATTAAPNVSTTNAVTSAPPAAADGVDAVLLDRLFASGKRLKGSDFGPSA